MAPLVSVIMTTLDAAAHVREAVESVRAQTMAEWELIVVDGGSKDGTRPMLAAFGDGRIRVLDRPGLRRIPALNVGFRAARAPLVAVLDADDVALPGRLAAQLAAFEADPGLAVVGSAKVPFIDEAGRRTGLFLLPRGDRELREGLKRRHQFFHSSVAYRKSAWDAAGGFDESLPFYEDYDLWVRLGAHGRYLNLDEELSLKRRHAGQAFHARHITARGYRTRARILRRHYRSIERDAKTLLRSFAFLFMSAPLHRLLWSEGRRRKANEGRLVGVEDARSRPPRQAVEAPSSPPTAPPPPGPAPRVSVIMTTYNAARHLREALDSVAAQGLRDHELVVVDDGSTDETVRILREAAALDRRIRIVQIPRAGRIPSMNEAVRQARAPFIANLDADDLFLPGRLAATVAALEADPRLGFVGAGTMPVIDDAGRPLPGREFPTDPRRLRDALGWYCAVFHSSATYRKAAWDSVGGFDERLPIMEDYDFWVRVAGRWKVANLPQALAVKRRHFDQNFAFHMRDAAVQRTKATIMFRYMRNVRPGPRIGLKAAKHWLLGRVAPLRRLARETGPYEAEVRAQLAARQAEGAEDPRPAPARRQGG